MTVFSFPAWLGSIPQRGSFLFTEPRRSILRSIGRRLSSSRGLEMGHVVFVNPYPTADIPSRVMNERYARRFEFGNTPGRATIEVAAFPKVLISSTPAWRFATFGSAKRCGRRTCLPVQTASPCVFAGDTLYCSAKSGFIPGPHGGVYATTTQHQARQTMRNLLDNLEEAGMDFSQ